MRALTKKGQVVKFLSRAGEDDRTLLGRGYKIKDHQVCVGSGIIVEGQGPLHQQRRNRKYDFFKNV